MKLVFDLETDGLLDEVSTVWCCGTLTEGDEQAVVGVNHVAYLDYLDKANVLIGHNIIGFDLPVLKKLFNWEHNKECILFDTWLVSKMLYPHRQSHSLAAWGETLGYPKGEHNDWTKYSREMATYCKKDVEITAKLYEVLWKKARKI